MNDNIMNDKEFYYSLYSKELVDKADSYFKESGTFNDTKMGAMIKLAQISGEGKTVEEIGKEFNELLYSPFMFAYLHGACENSDMTEDEMRPNYQNGYSDFRKKRDFCVFFDFRDNDFGEHIRKGAEMYVNRYNSILSQIDLYKDDTNWNPETSLYVKDIENLEKIDVIKNVLSYGVMSSDIESNADYNLLFTDKEWKDPRDAALDAYDQIGYLGLWHDGAYKVGTYEEVEKWVVARHEGAKSLTEMWNNGESLVIAIVDGKMEYWIK